MTRRAASSRPASSRPEAVELERLVSLVALEVERRLAAAYLGAMRQGWLPCAGAGGRAPENVGVPFPRGVPVATPTDPPTESQKVLESRSSEPENYNFDWQPPEVC